MSRALTDVFVHGSDSGYFKHRRRDEEPCGPCLDAHRAAARESSRRRREKPRVDMRACSRCGIGTYEPDMCRDCVDVVRDLEEEAS